MQQSLKNVSGLTEAFDLKVTGTGCFPNKRKPRVFWLGLQHDINNTLFKLHEWVDQKLDPLGFPREKRRFSPHLTLGRVKTEADYHHVFDFFEKSPFPTMQFKVTEVIFMRSQLHPQGAIYTPIEKYQLQQ